MVVARLITASGDVIDEARGQPAATPSPPYAGGFLELELVAFGLITLDDVEEVRLIVQAWDNFAGSVPCFWRHKMMATPV